MLVCINNRRITETIISMLDVQYEFEPKTLGGYGTLPAGLQILPTIMFSSSVFKIETSQRYSLDSTRDMKLDQMICKRLDVA